MRSVFLLFLAGCPGTEPCGGGDPNVELGTGVGGLFEPVESGDDLTLGAAAQGGNGVRLNIRTTGLNGTEPMDVEVTGQLAGEPDAPFVFDQAVLFCQPSGELQIENITVGFDQSLGFDDLADRPATLIVTVTDSEGTTADARVDVTLRAP